jgi:hypothetical protein
MTSVLAFLERAGVRSIRLDATPLGRPLYESLGFAAEATILRHQGIPAVSQDPGAELPGVDARDRDAILTLDRLATGADRRKLIDRLFADNPDLARTCRVAGSIAGFALARPGSRALHIGPCIAEDAAGPALLRDAFRLHVGRPVIIDIPESHHFARALAESAGLTVARTLTRMGRGDRASEDLDRIWASSGPEMG